MASKDFYYPLSIGIAIGVALSSLVLFSYHQNGGCTSDNDKLYSLPDQPKRFAKAKETNNRRVLDIDAFYHPTSVAGKTVLVTGGNRGIGRAIADELVKQGAKVIITSRTLVAIPNIEVIPNIDVQDNQVGNKLVEALKGYQIDILINNAGYFYEPVEKIDSLNFEEELKMIDICALGPLRITAALFNAGRLATGAKVVMISSQGGSIAWRKVQNPEGHDYGHHMSKAAENMMSVLLAQELKQYGIIISIIHPGFNKTDMTKKYEEIWEIEGAVDPSVGAKRVIHEISLMTANRSGAFINAEDGLLIPW